MIELKRQQKKSLNQLSKVIWLTGLSGSGKSTIANHLEQTLLKKGFHTMCLDGDALRKGLSKDLGFSPEDCYENIRRISEVSKLFHNCGIICINSFITPTNFIRKMAYDIIGRHNIIEIFVDTPISICEKRDTKGLYAKARDGKINNFAGVNSLFESPLHPDIVLKTEKLPIKRCVDIILNKTIPLISIV